MYALTRERYIGLLPVYRVAPAWFFTLADAHIPSRQYTVLALYGSKQTLSDRFKIPVIDPHRCAFKHWGYS